MQQQMQERLAALKKDFETGQSRLKELETEQTYLRETLLRISGAIQVLQEILNQEQPNRPAEANLASAAPKSANGPS
jgi:predicted nuclease with TOPRIM domain